MSWFEQYLSLFFQSFFSFFSAILIISFFLFVFRKKEVPYRSFLYALPFLKIIYDFLQGVSRTSFWFQGPNPLELPPNHHLLTAGLGMTNFWPTLNIVLGVKDPTGVEYSAAIADYFMYWLKLSLGENSLFILGGLVFLISIFLFFKRSYQHWIFRQSLKKKRKKVLEIKKVKVFLLEKEKGSPFVYGLFSPKVYLPEKCMDLLTKEELNATLFHELAHAKCLDLLWLNSFNYLGDFLWFIPFYQKVLKKFAHERELMADRFALKLGASKLHLAQALIKVQENFLEEKDGSAAIAFVGSSSAFSRRVQVLLEEKKRNGFYDSLLWPVIIGLTFMMVMSSTVGGHYQARQGEGFVEKLMNSWEK